MQFEISDEEVRKAKVPHEIFLTNLVGNHILWFVASLGMAGSLWQPLAMVPVISILTLSHILWRARRAKSEDPWFVMCHWQICAGRSRVFLLMMALLGVIALLGWMGHLFLGMRDVAVIAMIGGIGVLPVMVTVLVLIVMESDLLHQAGQQRVPKRVAEKLLTPDIKHVQRSEEA